MNVILDNLGTLTVTNLKIFTGVREMFERRTLDLTLLFEVILEPLLRFIKRGIFNHFCMHRRIYFFFFCKFSYVYCMIY